MAIETDITTEDAGATGLVRLGLAHLAIAGGLILLTGAAAALPALQLGLAVAAGFVITTLIHEWFHLLGAWSSGGRFSIPARIGLFTYNWDFPSNSTGQFFVMSIAGSVGSLVGIGLFWIIGGSAGDAALAMIAGACASLGFAAAIEWPVLARTARSGQPLEELAKINGRVLVTSLVISAATGLLTFQVLGT